MLTSKLTKLLLLLFALSIPAASANHFVSPNGAGTKSGASWTNACQGFIGSCLPTSLVRGDTYYVADSDGVNYPNVDFNKAESGTTRITIKKCTTTDGVSSGAAGYVSTLCDGFAKWSGALSSSDMVSFSTGYWTFDGITPQSLWASTGYGFRVDTSVSTNAAVYLGGSNNLVRNVEVIGDGGDGNGGQAGGGNKGVFFGPNVGSTGNHTVEYVYTHDNGSQPTYIVSNGNTLQYSRIEHNESTAGDHSEGTYISSLDNATPVTNTTIRYNFYKNIEGTGHIAMGPVNTVAIYGNVFWGTTGIAGGGIGNGVITRFTQWNVTTVVVYNNTCVDAVKCVSFFVGGDVGTTSSVTSNNNLSYNATMNNDNVTTHNYSWCQTSDAFCPGEANLQTSSNNPFVDYAGGNFHLTGNTNAGLVLASPYNLDAYGNAFDSSGTWTRGAIAFTCPQGSATVGDGCASAPGTTANYPSALNGFAVRPSFNVAGVDYGVGIPTGTILTDWRAISDSRLTVNTTTGTITCNTPGSTITLIGIDFTVQRTTSLQDGSASCQWTVKNSKFGCPNNGIGNVLVDQIDFENNEIDQNSCTATDNPSTMLQTAGSSGRHAIIKYNWFKHSWQHINESGPPGYVEFRYNLIDDSLPAGGAFGQHENFQQLSAASAAQTVNTDQMEFNFAYHHTSGTGQGEGFQFYCNSNQCSNVNPTLIGNVFICSTTCGISSWNHGGDPGTVTNGTNRINYFASQSAYYQGGADNDHFNSGWTNTCNINMTNGLLINPIDNSESSAAACASGGGSPPGSSTGAGRFRGTVAIR